MEVRKLITIREVAEEAGVSLATTSRVLSGRGYASESASTKVRQAAQRLGYRPNLLARNLKREKTDTIGLMITDIVNPFYAVLADGVLSCAQKLGYHVILCATNEDERLESEYLHVLMSQRAAGIIAVPTGQNIEIWSEVHSIGVKLVLVDRELAGLPQADVVLVDNQRGAYDAVSYLVSLGHTRIAVINGPLATTTGRERLEGYIHALQTAGITIADELVKMGSFTRSGGEMAVRQLLALKEPPTAIFATNNQLGEAAYTIVREQGLVIPEDISLIMFDDVSWASLVHPPLTTVAQPTFEMGYLGTELVHRKLVAGTEAGQLRPLESRLIPKLIVRTSCAQPRATLTLNTRTP